MRVLEFAVFIVFWVWLTGGASAAQTQIASPNQKHPSSGNSNFKKFDWNLYFQVRYTGIEDADDLFALRRFKLMLRGHLSEQVEYFAQGLFKDGNKSDTDGRPYLQESWVKLSHWKYAHVTIGQFKPPFGLERFTSDAEIFTIDRSQPTDRLIPNGSLGDSFARDRGIQLDGRTARDRLSYAVGVFDGQGANHQFHGIGPLVVARVTYQAVHHRLVAKRPLNIHIGGAFSTRRARDLDFNQACPGNPQLQHFRGRDTRRNLELAADWVGSSLRAEYFQAQFNPLHPTGPPITATGFYVQGAQFLMGKFQAVVKYELLDPNRRVLNNMDIRWTTVGLNYYFNGHRTKVMADYVFKRERMNPLKNDALLVQFQLYLN